MCVVQCSVLADVYRPLYLLTHSHMYIRTRAHIYRLSHTHTHTHTHHHPFYTPVTTYRPTGGKGDLVLEVELLFPTHISETQKMLIKSAFFLSAAPSKEQNKALRQYEMAFKDPLHGW